MEFYYPVCDNEKGAKMTIPSMYNIIFLDISAITILIVLAYLSRRLGEALKTPPFYRLFYTGIVLIIIAAILNTISVNSIVVTAPEFSNIVPIVMRFFSGFLAVFTCMQYWKWLFTEFFNR